LLKHYSSYLWDEVPFWDGDAGHVVLNIDPTDKRFEFKDEVQRFVQTKKKPKKMLEDS
jgi:hypothetical protein